MKVLVRSFLVLVVLLAGGLAFSAQAQRIDVPKNESEKPSGQRTFRDEEGGYQVVLEDGWRSEVTTENNGRRSVEIIFRDRSYALFKIKREKLEGKPSDINPVTAYVQQEIEGDLRFRPDYKFESQERLVCPAGKGVMLQFTFRKAGKLSTGRYYYLQTAPDTLWVLRCTGEKNYLDPLRYQTDQVARTFSPLP